MTKNNTVFEDILQMVHSTWEFFVPSISRLLITVIIFSFVFGSESLNLAFSLIVLQLNFLKSKGIPDLLESYKLLSLVPVIVLFFLVFFVYAFDRIVFGIANFFPLKLSYSLDNIFLGLPEAESIWQKSPSVNYPSRLLDVVDITIAQARIDGRSKLLDKIDSWELPIASAYSQYSFMVFLICFLFVCLIFSLNSSLLIQPHLAKFLVVLVFEITFLAIFAAQFVYAIKQQLYSKAFIANTLMSLETIESKDKEGRYKHIHDNLESYRTSLKPQKWWYLSLDFNDWVKMFWEFRFPSYRDSYKRYKQ